MSTLKSLCFLTMLCFTFLGLTLGLMIIHVGPAVYSDLLNLHIVVLALSTGGTVLLTTLLLNELKNLERRLK